jgi:hypothetical protein
MATMLRTLLSVSPWVGAVMDVGEPAQGFGLAGAPNTALGNEPAHSRQGNPRAAAGPQISGHVQRAKAVASVAKNRSEAEALAQGIARIEQRHAELQRTLSASGRRLLQAQFCSELERILDEQEHVASLLETAPDWARRTLSRQYFAIRSAAEILGLPNLAAIAGRAEVLLGLLKLGEISHSPLHGEVLKEVRSLLVESSRLVREQGHDQGAITAVQTVTCLFAAVEPRTLDYMPAPHATKSEASSGP